MYKNKVQKPEVFGDCTVYMFAEPEYVGDHLSAITYHVCFHIISKSGTMHIVDLCRQIPTIAGGPNVEDNRTKAVPRSFTTALGLSVSSSRGGNGGILESAGHVDRDRDAVGSTTRGDVERTSGTSW
jgi:hypothetical protein